MVACFLRPNPSVERTTDTSTGFGLLRNPEIATKRWKLWFPLYRPRAESAPRSMGRIILRPCRTSPCVVTRTPINVCRLEIKDVRRCQATQNVRCQRSRDESFTLTLSSVVSFKACQGTVAVCRVFQALPLDISASLLAITQCLSLEVSHFIVNSSRFPP